MGETVFAVVFGVLVYGIVLAGVVACFVGMHHDWQRDKAYAAEDAAEARHLRTKALEHDVGLHTTRDPDCHICIRGR